MTGFKNIIVGLGALVLMLPAVSWAASPSNANIPTVDNQASQPANTIKANLTGVSGCTVQSIETVGFGSYICLSPTDDQGLFKEFKYDATSNAKNFLVKASCGSLEKTVLLTSKETGNHWRLQYSQLLAAQLSGLKVKFGPEKLETCGNSDVSVANAVTLLGN